jgi:hypothetical protein
VPPLVLVLVVFVRRRIPARLPEPTGTALPLLYIVNICFKCFRYFNSMLQWLHMDIAKVDEDVAHVVYF